jgi:hypothetical protein
VGNCEFTHWRTAWLKACLAKSCSYLTPFICFFAYALIGTLASALNQGFASNSTLMDHRCLAFYLHHVTVTSQQPPVSFFPRAPLFIEFFDY